MAKIRGLDADVELSAQYQVPRRIYGIKPSADVQTRSGLVGPAKASGAEVVATNFLKSIASELGISVDPAHLRFDQIRRSPLGRHVLFQQYHDGKPISTGWVRVDIDDTDHIYNVQNDTVPTQIVERAVSARVAPPLRPDKAIDVALKESGANQSQSPEVLEIELVYFPDHDQPRLAWKVLVRATAPTVEWKFYIDADDGTILKKTDRIKRATGKATLFDPNPVVTLNDTHLSDNSTIADAAYKTVSLPDLAGTGWLDGKFASTRRTRARVNRPDHDFSAKRSDSGFTEAMAYFHIDRIQRYLQALGFDNILNGAIEIDANGIPDDNSFYQPSTRALTFGTGGVDDAEDADIILHEYGHAIQDAQVPGWGESLEALAMGEGFGDYLAATFFEAVKAVPLKACIGSWDAVAYSNDDPPCLRRLDSTKTYPRDVIGEEHADGEIWSAYLWQLRDAIAVTEVADRLIVAHHYLLTPAASFTDAANALITADQQLNAGQHESIIRELAMARGFL